MTRKTRDYQNAEDACCPRCGKALTPDYSFSEGDEIVCDICEITLVCDSDYFVKYVSIIEKEG